MEETNQKKRLSKGVIIAIIVGILLIGGGITAKILLNPSAKQAYFLAEKNTLEHVKEVFSERYEPELKWSEQSLEEPMEQSMELTAQYNGPTGYGMVDPVQVINNSSLHVNAKTDMNNKKIATELALNFAGMEIDGINIFLTDKEIILGLPFIEEYLQIKDEDFGPLLHEIDPYTFTGEESLELNSLFDSLYNEDDLEYLKKEYGEWIYEELSENAFTKDQETIEVNDKNVKADKVVFHLTEDEIHNLLSSLFEKLGNDDHLKEIMRKQLLTIKSGEIAVDAELDEIFTEFDEAMEEAKEAIYDVQIPDGMTSTIWINDDLIVKRDFTIGFGPDQSDGTMSIVGIQDFDNGNQFFDYDVTLTDSLDNISIQINGDLGWENNQITDTIELVVDDSTIAYKANESLDNGTRDFERVFSYNDSYTDGSLIWKGTSSYEKDQMTEEHQLSIETSETGNLITLNLMVDGKIIKEVELPTADKTKDLGSMSSEELTEYIENIYPQYEEWLYELMYGGSGW